MMPSRVSAPPAPHAGLGTPRQRWARAGIRRGDVAPATGGPDDGERPPAGGQPEPRGRHRCASGRDPPSRSRHHPRASPWLLPDTCRACREILLITYRRVLSPDVAPDGICGVPSAASSSSGRHLHPVRGPDAGAGRRLRRRAALPIRERRGPAVGRAAHRAQRGRLRRRPGLPEARSPARRRSHRVRRLGPQRARRARGAARRRRYEAGCHQARTAERLEIHVKSVRYRAYRAEEMLGHPIGQRRLETRPA